MNITKKKLPVSLPYDPSEFPRELSRHYITADDREISEMLNFVGLDELDDLYKHIPEVSHFNQGLNLPEELNYQDAVEKLSQISLKTNLSTSFIGDTLPSWKQHPIVDFVSKLRPLSTSYTP